MDNSRPLYLDNNATTPVDPRVLEVAIHYMREEFGNAGSRTHQYGTVAKQAVAKARRIIANAVNATPNDVIFTSGATESNNLAILGLAPYGVEKKRMHIISSPIEHKAVLEPLEEMERRGFEVSFLPMDSSGVVKAEDVGKLLRDDTLLVSVMHANNETGMIQPIEEIAEILEGHEAFFHTDAAQTFGKLLEPLRNDRIDLISVSGHKLYSPKGIGCLIATKNARDKLTPLVWGGGQEGGLRPGTLPVHLIAALGQSVGFALAEIQERKSKCLEFRDAFLIALEQHSPHFFGDQNKCLYNTLSFAIPPYDADAIILLFQDSLAISTGSACTSQVYSLSHVLSAMQAEKEVSEMAIRASWSHYSDQKFISEAFESLP